MEYLDIVDENDEVVGKATRDEIHQKKLSHRIIHVLIFNKNGEMALQMRSPTVHYCPNHWSTAVGGHVQSGETYEQAAKREASEESGIDLDKIKFNFLYKEVYQVPNGPQKFLSIYKTIYEGPFHSDSEVSKIEFFTLEKIKEMINKGEKFHPELLFILKKHFL